MSNKQQLQHDLSQLIENVSNLERQIKNSQNRHHRSQSRLYQSGDNLGELSAQLRIAVSAILTLADKEKLWIFGKKEQAALKVFSSSRVGVLAFPSLLDVTHNVRMRLELAHDIATFSGTDMVREGIKAFTFGTILNLALFFSPVSWSTQILTNIVAFTAYATKLGSDYPGLGTQMVNHLYSAIGIEVSEPIAHMLGQTHSYIQGKAAEDKGYDVDSDYEVNRSQSFGRG